MVRLKRNQRYQIRYKLAQVWAKFRETGPSRTAFPHSARAGEGVPKLTQTNSETGLEKVFLDCSGFFFVLILISSKFTENL